MKGCKNRNLSDSLKSDQRLRQLQERSQVRVPGSAEEEETSHNQDEYCGGAAEGGLEVSLNMLEEA